MSGKGRCANARSAGSGRDKSVIDHIMLRFRPIAPKPGGDCSSFGKSTSESCDKITVNGRKKRKYVRVRKQCERRKTPPGGEAVGNNGERQTAATLQLPPERSNGEDMFAAGSWSDLDHAESTRAFERPLVSLNFEEYCRNAYVAVSAESMADVPPARVVSESTVIMECVTETFMDVGGGGGGGEGLGNSDRDRIKSLEVDTCPGFVSDSSNLVQWVNEAYKKMVRGEDYEYQWPHQFRVCLVMKERLPYLYPMFACRVRLEYTWRERKHARTMPCDVWRMDGGGFAWRLDVNAALSLAIS